MTLTEKMMGIAINEDGLFDEKMLKRELKKAQSNWGPAKWNKEKFEEVEPRFKSCINYEPCPICDKCKNKSSNLFVRCEICEIPTCTHTTKDMKMMIRKENFKLNIKF